MANATLLSSREAKALLKTIFAVLYRTWPFHGARDSRARSRTSTTASPHSPKHKRMTEDRSTVYVETYGCQMNVSDSELILGKLAASGYDQVETREGADVILVNTCAIREHAEQRVMGRLGEMKSRMKKNAILGVTGCMAQRLGPQILARAGHVSLVIGPDGYRSLPLLVENARRGIKATSTDFDLEEHYEDFKPRRFDKVKAWIPVQRGCDYRCTYCIVPTTRGPERSRKLEEVVREASRSSLTECPKSFSSVRQSIRTRRHSRFRRSAACGRQRDGVRRLRFTSPHPNDFSDRVIAAIADTDAVCEHVHLPMQSGSTASSRGCSADIARGLLRVR